MNNPRSTRLPPFHKRLGFRVAIWIAASLLLADLALIPFLPEIYKFFHPEWWDPEYLRWMADELEAEAAPKPPEQNETVQQAVSILWSLAYAAAIALVAGFAISRVGMRRLTRLTAQVGEPVSDGLPGPFEDQGRDEIAILGSALNGMRTQVGELLETLERRDQERREWIAQVSHDIRTPLTSLMVRIDRLEKDLGQHPTLIDIRSDAKRVVNLTDDLLEIGRLDTVDPLHLEPVPPQELAERTVRSLSVVGEERGVKVSFQATTEVPILDADGHRLARALENIVLNSIQHARAAVDVSVTNDNGTVDIIVEDDGPGLQDSKPRPDSTGLGLTVAKKVVEAHGGRLLAQPSDAGGARFVLSVPVEESGGLESP